MPVSLIASLGGVGLNRPGVFANCDPCIQKKRAACAFAARGVARLQSNPTVETPTLAPAPNYHDSSKRI